MRKKLSLNRETLRKLNESHLREVRGGGLEPAPRTKVTCVGCEIPTAKCVTTGCPPSTEEPAPVPADDTGSV